MRKTPVGDAPSPLGYKPNPSPTKDTEVTFGIIAVISWTRQCALAVSMYGGWCTEDALFHPAGSRPRSIAQEQAAPSSANEANEDKGDQRLDCLNRTLHLPSEDFFYLHKLRSADDPPVVTESELGCRHVDPSYMSAHLKHITELDSISGFSAFLCAERVSAWDFFDTTPSIRTSWL